MFERTVSPDDLDRLAAEREDAERGYNDALTRLDQALPRPFEAGRPPDGGGARGPAGLDAPAATPWPPPDVPRRYRWLLPLLAPIVGPAFAQQERTNRALVAHLNERAAAAGAERRHAEETVARIGAHLAEALTFQSRLLQYLQRITPFVDTKDRETAGLMRRINEDNGVLIDSAAAAIDGVTAAIEALAVRERGLRESVQVLHGGSRVAARELHRLRDRLAGLQSTPQPAPASAADAGEPAGPAATDPADAGGEPAGPAATDPGPAPEAAAAPGAPAPASGAPAPALADATAYAIFEDAFRGAQTDIAARQRRYVACFEGASDVLDVGCGRGEFLELLRDGGIAARGIDVNAEMVERCRERGLEATRADALAHVAGLPEESLGGLFSAQVVEHLDADYLLRLLAAVQRALRPGARIVLETINPASWSAFFWSYIRDITHRQPLHPDTLGYLLRAHGFVDVEIVYSAPVPDTDRLRRAPAGAGVDAAPNGAALRGLIETYNRNVDKLNGLLFAHQDYAAIGTRA